MMPLTGTTKANRTLLYSIQREVTGSILLLFGFESNFSLDSNLGQLVTGFV